jgi:hypothetical protein
MGAQGLPSAVGLTGSERKAEAAGAARCIEGMNLHKVIERGSMLRPDSRDPYE